MVILIVLSLSGKKNYMLLDMFHVGFVQLLPEAFIITIVEFTIQLHHLFIFYFIGLSIVGKANLEKEDLEPALKALKDGLMTKNVVCLLLI